MQRGCSKRAFSKLKTAAEKCEAVTATVIMAPAGEKKVGVHSDQSWIMIALHTLYFVFVYYVSRHVA